MTDIELQALTALVNADTAQLNQQIAQYGEQQCSFEPSPRPALEAELVRRGVLEPRPTFGVGETTHG